MFNPSLTAVASRSRQAPFAVGDMHTFSNAYLVLLVDVSWIALRPCD